MDSGGGPSGGTEVPRRGVETPLDPWAVPSTSQGVSSGSSSVLVFRSSEGRTGPRRGVATGVGSWCGAPPTSLTYLRWSKSGRTKPLTSGVRDPPSSTPNDLPVAGLSDLYHPSSPTRPVFDSEPPPLGCSWRG